ncbi:MAG: helix-turn-helix transcriptional regulator [Candidatus Babeliales bacterium]|jgi:transcriptional regulator with XRE-family HTH domain
MNINGRIKAARKALKLTQIEFAEGLRIKQSSLSYLESSKSESISDRNIALICKEYNVNESWLRTGEGEMFVSEKDLVKVMSRAIETLDETDKKIIREYLKLSPEHKKIMKAFFKSAFGK